MQEQTPQEMASEYGLTGAENQQPPPYFTSQNLPAPQWDTVLGSDKPNGPSRP